jgi:hypothetical protein
MALELKRYLFTRAEYHRLAEAGILGEDDRVELIEGEILEISPIGRRHWACVDRLTHLFVREVGDEAIVHVQNPIPVSERSEPQPDLTLTPGPTSPSYGSWTWAVTTSSCTASPALSAMGPRACYAAARRSVRSRFPTW